MRYRILVIRNKGTLPVLDHLDALVTWLRFKTPLATQVDYLDLDLPLRWKLFTHIEGKRYYGLDGLKEALRERTDIVYGYYQAIVFLYSPTGYDARDGVLACWTYPNHLFGAPLTEVFVDPVLYHTGQLPIFLAHELVHAMHRRLAFQGYFTVDDMDLYDKNHEIYAEDGNYARNLARFRSLWPRIAEEDSWLTVGRLKRMIEILRRKLTGRHSPTTSP